MKNFVFITLLLFCISGIGAQASYELIIQDEIGGPKKPEILVIKEPKALKEFYIGINKTRRPGYALPKVDFKSDAIIILCVGAKPTGGYAMEIDRIENNEEKLSVFITEIIPDATNLTKISTEPFSIYKIKHKSKPIVFVKNK